jgi:hypothetical protein
MKIKVYLHYLKLKDFMDYQPIYIKTSFSSADDIETFIDLRKVFLVKQSQGMLIRRKRWYEILFHTKSIK